MDFSALAASDHVRIVGRDATGKRISTRDVTDPAQITALYHVVESRPDGWRRPWPEMPASRWSVTFSRDGREVGSFGVGNSFLTIDGYLRNLAGADLRDVLALLQGPAGP